MLKQWLGDLWYRHGFSIMMVSLIALIILLVAILPPATGSPSYSGGSQSAPRVEPRINPATGQGGTYIPVSESTGINTRTGKIEVLPRR